MVQKSGDSDGRPDRSRWLGFFQIVLILAVVAVALYLARAPERVERDAVSALSAEDSRPVVSVIHPTRTDQALTVALTGEVSLAQTARLKPEVAGRVIWVSPEFTNGGSIGANERLVRIDPTEYELRVKAAAQEVREAEARVRIARARGEENAKGFAREYPDAEASDWVRRLPHIAKAEARLEKTRAELELARLQLARTDISLPYPARVIASRIEVGEYVGPDLAGASPFMGIVYRPEALQVEAPIEPKDLEYLNPVIGRSARVRTRGGAYDAEVVRVSSVIAPGVDSRRSSSVSPRSMRRTPFHCRAPLPKSRLRDPRTKTCTFCRSRCCRSRAASGSFRKAPCAHSSPGRSGARTKARWWKSSTPAREWSSERCRERGRDWRSRWRMPRRRNSGV